MVFKHFRFEAEHPFDQLYDILTAYLAEAGFEGFHTDDKELNAYIPETELNPAQLNEILSLPVFSSSGLRYEVTDLPEKNWNEEWEKSYAPVIVDDICAIVAPFHHIPRVSKLIRIEPKMAFGTGHHSTTKLMIRQMNDLDMSGKKVLDMGCGTGILGIFALMNQAKFVTAIDIDHWACENSRENFSRNEMKKVQFEIIYGDAGSIPARLYEIILANINRNILLADLESYVNHLAPGGNILLSGILSSDREIITEAAINNGLALKSERIEGNWISLAFKKTVG